MPEIPDKEELEIRRKLQEQKASLRSEGRSQNPDDIAELLEQNPDFSFVGMGRECVVVKRRSKPETVVAFSYEDMTPEQAKEVFYLQRIMATLFPHNFPRFYASFGSEEGKFSGSFRQQIGDPEVNESLKSLGTTKLDKTAKYPFKDVIAAVGQLHLPVDCDMYSKNFTLAADGGVYYLDVLTRESKLDRASTEWDVDRIDLYMQTHAYSPKDIKVVKMCIQRLESIYEKEKSLEPYY